MSEALEMTATTVTQGTARLRLMKVRSLAESLPYPWSKPAFVATRANVGDAPNQHDRLVIKAWHPLHCLISISKTIKPASERPLDGRQRHARVACSKACKGAVSPMALTDCSPVSES